MSDWPVIESEMREDPPFDIKVEWVVDEDPLIDFIGRYVDKAEPGVIDRQTGILYGNPVDEPEEPEEPEFTLRPPEPEDFAVGDKNGYEAECNKFNNAYWAWRHECRDVLEPYNAAYSEWDSHYGLEVLADGLRSTYGWRERNFFKPYAGGEKVGSEYFVKYALQDYECITGLERGHWCFTGCVVTLYCDGVEVGSDSLWGIESDCGEECRRTVEQDCIAQAKAHVGDYIERATGVLAKLKEE